MKKAMTPHSSTLAWKILWIEESDGLQFVGCKELDKTEHTHTHTHIHNLPKGKNRKQYNKGRELLYPTVSNGWIIQIENQ